MPIFEFECLKCGQVTPFLEKSDSRTAHPCQRCGSGDTRKIFSSFSARVGKAVKPAPSACSGACGTGSCPMAGKM